MGEDLGEMGAMEERSSSNVWTVFSKSAGSMTGAESYSLNAGGFSSSAFVHSSFSKSSGERS